MQAGCGFFCQPDRRAYAWQNGGQGMAGMKAAMDDQSVAQRVLDHIAKGTTDVGQEVWREPVANYRSTERLAAEIERILRRPRSGRHADRRGARVRRQGPGLP